MFVQDKDDSRKKLFGLIYWRDIILLLAVLLAALCIRLVMNARGTAGYAVIQVDGQEVYRLPMNVNDQRTFAAGNYTYTVSVKDNTVAVTEADCPDKICVQTGAISRSGQAIACVPGGMTVTVEGSDSVSSAADASTF